MCRPSLDTYDDYPRDMLKYLRANGWHFNKKSVKYAVSLMKKRNPTTGKLEKMDLVGKEQVDEILSKFNIKLDKNTGYDYVFAYNMGKADYFKSSIPDEQHLALYVKDVIDDPDAGDGTIMRRWFASMVALGEPVEWEDFL